MAADRLTALNLDAWWDEPGYKAAHGTFSERGVFILAKLRKHDAAKLQDVMLDLDRDAQPDPMVHHEVPVADHPSLHGRE